VAASVFQPREACAALGSMAAHYFNICSSTRDELLALAAASACLCRSNRPARSRRTGPRIERMLSAWTSSIARCTGAGRASRASRIDDQARPAAVVGQAAEGLEKTGHVQAGAGFDASMAPDVADAAFVQQRVAVLSARFRPPGRAWRTRAGAGAVAVRLHDRNRKSQGFSAQTRREIAVNVRNDRSGAARDAGAGQRARYSSMWAERRTAAPGKNPNASSPPDVSLAQPAVRDLGVRRDLFSPPRDTHPLPPLDIEPLPLAPLTALFPPPLPAPAPEHYGKFLRASAAPVAVAGLFATDADSAAQLSEDQAPVEAAPGALAIDDALTGDQRAAQLEGLKKLYDWFRRDDGAPRFGNIRNPDKFGLRQRQDEALLFLEINPATD
jgi:hypothetical protein